MLEPYPVLPPRTTEVQDTPPNEPLDLSGALFIGGAYTYTDITRTQWLTSSDTGLTVVHHIPGVHLWWYEFSTHKVHGDELTWCVVYGEPPYVACLILPTPQDSKGCRVLSHEFGVVRPY